MTTHELAEKLYRCLDVPIALEDWSDGYLPPNLDIVIVEGLERIVLEQGKEKLLQKVILLGVECQKPRRRL